MEAKQLLEDNHIWQTAAGSMFRSFRPFYATALLLVPVWDSGESTLSSSVEVSFSLIAAKPFLSTYTHKHTRQDKTKQKM